MSEGKEVLRCQTCIYWEAMAGTDIMVCKRYPPNALYKWPRTGWMDWCGEHKDKENK